MRDVFGGLRRWSSTVNDEAEFEGVFISHWELAGFLPTDHRFWLQWFPFRRRDKWYVHFPSGFELPTSTTTPAPRELGPGRRFRMRVRGSLGPKGRFGHLGTSNRELFVSRVIECEEVRVPWWRM